MVYPVMCYLMLIPDAGMKFDEFVTVKQAAEFLGIPWATLRNWDRSGKVKALRHPVNGYRLYRLEQLQALLKTVVPGGATEIRKEAP